MKKRSIVMVLMLQMLCASAFAQGAGQRQIAWNDLPMIFNKNIRIVMPDGTRIEGRATELETDALAVQVGKTTNENSYPKGRLLVPRATLKSFDIGNSTRRWRVAGTVTGITIGAVAGAVVGLVSSAIGASDGVATGVAIAGISGVTVAGYYLGRQADRRVTTYVVTQ